LVWEKYCDLRANGWKTLDVITLNARNNRLQTNARPVC
jgi:hypothetical protein